MKELFRLGSHLAIGCCLALGIVSAKSGEQTLPESQIKALFLLNFTKYVDWPPAAFPKTNSPVIVGILNQEEVSAAFRKMIAGKDVNGHPIQFKPVASPADCTGCHMLFIGDSARRQLPEIIQRLRGASVLTVGESENFVDNGGMINLVLHDQKISLEVNLSAAREADLRISSKLLSLAKVRGGPN